MLKLYFAHNFNNRKEYRKLELKLEKELGIELFNPFYDDIDRKEEMEELDKAVATAKDRIGQFKNRFNRVQDQAKDIVQRDLKNLASCDGLFTMVEKPSFGTTIEICNAVMMRKPIYFVSKVYTNHPWIKIYTDYRFETLEGFKMWILLEQTKRKDRKRNR
jgi:nucleoside 2-deoxyribosyltransferase